MTLSEKNKQIYSSTEINVLTDVINYCDRMIYEDDTLDARNGLVDNKGYVNYSQSPLYRVLRRSAYAKTVVIETQLQGVKEFRLSPTEAVYPNVESGYCTPHSAVGRLISFATPGYEGWSKLWGDYRIVEVRSFDRYSGPAFESNVRNFMRMDVSGECGDGTVLNLVNYHTGLPESRSVSIRVPVAISGVHEERATDEKTPAPLPIGIYVAEFNVIEDVDDFVELDIDHEDDWGDEQTPVKADDYYGLSERFFTHQTAEQNQIIARSPIGAMFVEGIAGSGKTSAALGRTKMLTTFNSENVIDEDVFRDVVGEGQEYWSGQFAGQFSQESCIGFVRTGELIQYLQETCRRIDLPNLPVHEYKELQTRLREQRRVTSSSNRGRRWAGLAHPRNIHEPTTMKWLHAVDQLVARKIASSLISSLPSVDELAAGFEPKIRDKVLRVVSVALEHLVTELSFVVEELCRKPRSGGFALDRLASRLSQKIDEVRKRVMAPKVIWLRSNGITLFANDENALARKLVDLNARLYLRSGRRLVFLGEVGPVDSTLKLLDASGNPVLWSAETRQLMEEGKIFVREDSGDYALTIPSDVNHLFMRLLPEAVDRIYEKANGQLRRLPREQGWGRIKLAMLPTERGEDLGEEDAEEDFIIPGQLRKRTPDAEFSRLVRRHLFGSLTNLADLYSDTLESYPSEFPDASLAAQLHTQLVESKLADDDIDLLLCLSHIIGRGLKQGGPSQLRELDFYQAVFVDEVQDFTEQQVYLMVEQANPKYQAVTIVGDIAQKLHHGSSIDLPACFPARAVPHIRLTENMRQAHMPGLALFSAIFRSELQNDAVATDYLAVKAKAQGAALVSPSFLLADTLDKMDNIIVEALSSITRAQTVAVLFPTKEAAAKVYARLEQRLRENHLEAELSASVNLARRHIRHFAAVASAKGLEFDVVLLAGIEDYDLDNATQVNGLYVGITRARQSLVLLSEKTALPSKLSQVREAYEKMTIS